MTVSDSPSVKSSDGNLAESKLDTSSNAVHIETIPSSEDESDSIEHTDIGKVTWFISATVSLGGFLFGIATPFSYSLLNWRRP